jgi:hypothetical protein
MGSALHPSRRTAHAQICSLGASRACGSGDRARDHTRWVSRLVQDRRCIRGHRRRSRSTGRRSDRSRRRERRSRAGLRHTARRWWAPGDRTARGAHICRSGAGRLIGLTPRESVILFAGEAGDEPEATLVRGAGADRPTLHQVVRRVNAGSRTGARGTDLDGRRAFWDKSRAGGPLPRAGDPADHGNTTARHQGKGLSSPLGLRCRSAA